MQALTTVIWLAGAILTARFMYGRWRPSINERGILYVTELAAPTPGVRRVWAAIFSFFICLIGWPFALLVIAVMAKPPKTSDEKKRERMAEKAHVAELEREAETLRDKLAQLRSEHGSQAP